MGKLMDSATMTILSALRDLLGYWIERENKQIEMWRRNAELAESDPKAFLEHERKVGSAMLQDPPEDWKEEDLITWSAGNAHGRYTGQSNAVQGLEYAKRGLDLALRGAGQFGFRDGIPTPEQVKKHKKNAWVGAWVIIFKTKGFPGQWATCVALDVNEAGEIVVYKGREEGDPLSAEDRENILRCFPLDPVTGLPTSWLDLPVKISY